MLQRIQTLFLLASFFLLMLLFWLPIAENIFVLQFPLLMLQIITIAVNLTTIFSYKRRPLQIRYCILNGLCLLVYQGIAIFVVARAVDSHWQLPLVFPAIATICTFIAIRYIAKDEALVRSQDRLR
jgi:hypothetical protein